MNLFNCPIRWKPNMTPAEWDRWRSMTEEEWLSWDDSLRMCHFLRSRFSNNDIAPLGGQKTRQSKTDFHRVDFNTEWAHQSFGRKGKLFGCACCRRIWHLISDPHERRNIQIAEERADNPSFTNGNWETDQSTYQTETREIAQCTKNAVYIAVRNAVFGSWVDVARYAAGAVAWNATGEIRVVNGIDLGQPARDLEKRSQADLLRDIFGNPFRPVPFSPSWLTPTVTALAQSIYEDRRFDALPILADALEEAGCTNDNILAHGRDGSEHARGCWVVDGLLAKS